MHNTPMGFFSSLFKIALPIILQNFLSSFVNMLDTIMVGQLGAVDIAAVGLANQLFFVMQVMMFGVVSGGSIFITQYWGKKDLDGVHRTVGITLAFSTIVSLIFTFAALVFPEACLRIYSSDIEVITRGAVYLRFVAPSYIFTGFAFAFSNGCRSTEHVRLPMVVTAISVIINGIMNYLLIFGLKFGSQVVIAPHGIVGAAVATDIARIVECALIIIIPYIRKYEFTTSLAGYFRRQPGFLGRFLKIVVPVLLNESLWGIGASLQSSIFGHAGTDVVAAFNITNTTSNLIWTFFMGCGNATAIILGKMIGEQKFDEARHLAKKFAAFLGASGAALGLLLIPMAFVIPLFYNVDPQVIRIAQIFMYLTVLIYPLNAMNMFYAVGLCRSGGDTIYSLIMDTGFMWTISIPLGFVAVLFLHLPFWAVFLCVHTEDILKWILGFLRLQSGKWLHDVTE